MALSSDLDNQIEVLTRINTAEFLQILGLGWVKHGRRVLEKLCRPAARRISEDMARFDSVFASKGLQFAAREVLCQLIGRMDVHGAQHLPLTGPVLIVANHPGFCDVLTILATVERGDVLIVAADYQLLRALTGINRHFVFVPDSPAGRRQAFNRMVGYLRGGGAVLLLPAGEIEPDPAIALDAASSLRNWSASIGMVVKYVPDICVIPAVVQGVLLSRFQKHPLTWIRRKASDRQQLGTMLQVLARGSASPAVLLMYGQPLAGPELLQDGRGAREITNVVVEWTRALMDAPERARGARFGVAGPVPPETTMSH